ncbi:thiamine phosphate synthase [Candidatus Pelagibacter sp.]|uniref:thiamine phosphate synthase n=1 Tax=Candidatus Pelagibacter sp. TaxID=2024849 RepID=UPI003F85FDAB
MNIKYYFINNFETNNIDKLDKQTVVIYRNYNSKSLNKEHILKLKKYCQKRGLKFYLSNNVKLAMKLDLDGVYIPSFNKSTKHLSFLFKKKFGLIGSAHNIKEIKIKEMQKVNKIFISSVFKKNKNYLGINKFRLISNLTKKKVVALGGISKENIKKLKLLNTSEFAGISYFE